MSNYEPPKIPTPKHYDELFWKDFLLGVIVGKIYHSVQITLEREIIDGSEVEGGNSSDNKV